MNRPSLPPPGAPIAWRTSRCAPFATQERWWAAVRRDLLPQASDPMTIALEGCPALRFALGGRATRFAIGLPTHDHLSLADVAVADQLAVQRIGPALDTLLQAPGDGARRTRPLAWRAARIPDDSALLAAARLDASSGRWACHPVAASAWFELDNGPLPVPGKLRRNLQRLNRALQSLGEVHIEVHDRRDPTALAQAFDDFLRLEASGWKGAAGTNGGPGTAIAGDPRLLSFYRGLLDEDEDALHPQIALLRLDGRTIAAKYGLRSGDTLSLLKIAYDETYAAQSPGSQLLLGLMTQAQAAGITRLSLVTCPAWAARWRPLSAPVWHVTRYADSPGGRALARWDRTARRVRARLGRLRSTLRRTPSA